MNPTLNNTVPFLFISEINKILFLLSLVGYSLATGVFDRDKSYYVAGRPGFANNGGNIGNVSIILMGLNLLDLII